VPFNTGPFIEGFSGRPAINVYTPDDTQNFALGAKYTTWDGREYRYAKAGAAITVTDLAVKFYAKQAVACAALSAAAQNGDNILSVTVGAGDGVAANGAVAENEYQGGHVVVYVNSASTSFMRRIEWNTKVAAGGGAMTFGIEQPITAALSTSDNCEILSNIYSDVRTSQDTFRTNAGKPNCTATSGQFMWIQRGGTSWMSPAAAVGATAFSANLVFRDDGSVDLHSSTDASTLADAQRAGYVLANANSTSVSQGAPFIYLQLE